jgi:NAD+ kinase
VGVTLDTIRAVGIISRPSREQVTGVAPGLIEWLGARKIEVLFDEHTAACLRDRGRTCTPPEMAAAADLLIVLGGNGTLLAAARAAAPRGVPILAVNLGGLGFLTSVTPENLYAVLEEFLAGQHKIRERAMLAAEIQHSGKVAERQIALNEAVVNKGTLSRMIFLDLHIDGGFVCRYRADGLIVSTPTGSTAYSLSAGGPIIHPGVPAFVITPICPHTLSDRPLVVPDSTQIEIRFEGAPELAHLTLDGQTGVELKTGDCIRIIKADEKLKLVRDPQKTYYEILRNKLRWAES